MKKLAIILAIMLGILLFVSIIVAGVMHFNPNLNPFKLAKVEKNAILYFEEVYPDFEISEISVFHDWKPNYFRATCTDSSGEERKIAFDHTGERVILDEYLRGAYRKRVLDYEDDIVQQVTSVIEDNTEYDVYYTTVNVLDANDKEYEIAFENCDLSTFDIECSVGFSGGDNLQKSNFAKKALEVFELVKAIDLPLVKLEVIQHNNPESRYDVVFTPEMNGLTTADVELMVK